MGEVYRARDPRLHRDVAVKVLPAAFAEDQDRLHRFEQEARAAGILNHPNIVAIYDFGTHAGAPFVVSELLEGETLRRRLGGHALSPRKAVEIAVQIAHGLAAAHHRGIVHRDLKPENVFVNRDGRVKILDFGLAKLTRPDSNGQAASRAATVVIDTGPGAVWGTAGYMSPEQVRGKPVDHRSDMFAFGAILYEMLSGRRAFHGDSPADTMSAILREDPPEITGTGHAIPPALERIVRHCLEKNSEERFQSAIDLAFDLESITGLSGSGTVALAGPDTLARPSRIARVGLWCAAGAAALAASYWIGSTLGNGVSPAVPQFQQLTFGRGTILEARFSPDGNTIIYSAAWDGGQPKIYTTRTESPESRDIGLPSAIIHSISPSGEMAVEVGRPGRDDKYQYGTIARMPLSGGTPREILQGITDAAWDGAGSQLAVVRSDGGRSRIEYPPGTLLYASPGMIEEIRFSPDGTQIAFIDHPLPGDTRGTIDVIDVATKAKRTLSSGWLDVDRAAWHPSGSEVWFTATKSGLDRGLYAATLSGSVRAVTAIPGSLSLQDIDAKGRVLLARVSQRTRIRALAPGEAKEREFSWFDWSMVRDITPDGQKLLFDESGEGGGASYAAFLRGMDGSPAVRLADGAAGAVSPDGASVLAVEPDDYPRVKLIPVGPGEPRVLQTDSLIVGRARFLTDGKNILVRGNRRGESALWWVLPIGGGKPVPVEQSEDAARYIANSPDGKWVAFAKKGGKIRIQPLAGGRAREIAFADSTQIRSPVQWSADGRFLYALDPRSGTSMRIYKVDVRTGAESLWKTIEPPDPTGVFLIPEVVVARNGAAYAYSFCQMLGDLYMATGLK
jgi:Tol biopolymer transport system component